MNLKFIGKAYYKLTAYIPRRIPTSNEEFDFFLWVAHEHYGVPKIPNCIATMAAQFGAVPGYKKRIAWGRVANVALRLQSNKIANERKHAALMELQKAFEEELKKQTEEKPLNDFEKQKLEDAKEFINET